MYTSAQPTTARESLIVPRGWQSGTAAKADLVHLPEGALLRRFDLSREDPGQLIRLKEAVYGKSVSLPSFEWLYFGHPQSQDLNVYAVELDGAIVASTARMPAQIRLSGADRPAYFNIDSMAHPGFRRKGWMRHLYRFARGQLRTAPLFSKGSSPLIYPLLMRMGYQEITPSTYMVSYPSAARWIMKRLHLPLPSSSRQATVPAGFDDYRPIERFGWDHELFFDRAARRFPVIFRREAGFMNWRYIDIPHRRYFAFERIVDDRITQVIVLVLEGDCGRIVDLVWDPSREEPDDAIRFAQAFFDEHMAVRVMCFATHPKLRAALARCGFIDRGETPRFSMDGSAADERQVLYSGGTHVMDGDGDTEFS